MTQCLEDINCVVWQHKHDGCIAIFSGAIYMNQLAFSSKVICQRLSNHCFWACECFSYKEVIFGVKHTAFHNRLVNRKNSFCLFIFLRSRHNHLCCRISQPARLRYILKFPKFTILAVHLVSVRPPWVIRYRASQASAFACCRDVISLFGIVFAVPSNVKPNICLLLWK